MQIKPQRNSTAQTRVTILKRPGNSEYWQDVVDTSEDLFSASEDGKHTATVEKFGSPSKS